MTNEERPAGEGSVHVARLARSSYELCFSTASQLNAGFHDK